MLGDAWPCHGSHAAAGSLSSCRANPCLSPCRIQSPYQGIGILCRRDAASASAALLRCLACMRQRWLDLHAGHDQWYWLLYISDLLLPFASLQGTASQLKQMAAQRDKRQKFIVVNAVAYAGLVGLWLFFKSPPIQQLSEQLLHCSLTKYKIAFILLLSSPCSSINHLVL